MSRFDTDIEELRNLLDERLKEELFASCAESLALDRLETAVSRVVEAVSHPVLRLRRRGTGGGRTYTVYLLDRVLMRWCFSARCVDLYCLRPERGSSPNHIRFRYDVRCGGWNITRPGVCAARSSFSDEEQKVLEVMRDALAIADSVSGEEFLPTVMGRS